MRTKWNWMNGKHLTPSDDSTCRVSAAKRVHAFWSLSRKRIPTIPEIGIHKHTQTHTFSQNRETSSARAAQRNACAHLIAMQILVVARAHEHVHSKKKLRVCVWMLACPSCLLMMRMRAQRPKSFVASPMTMRHASCLMSCVALHTLRRHTCI